LGGPSKPGRASEKFITVYFSSSGWEASFFSSLSFWLFWNCAISATLLPKSISTGAQYVTLDNKIKCLRLAFFWGNPTNKTVTGTAHTWELLIANHLDQSL
jgi:hypothetical protein